MQCPPPHPSVCLSVCPSHLVILFLSLGIPGFPPGMPYGFVRIYFIYFLFRRQGFRMTKLFRTFDRQAAPLQNFNRSHVMVIGRSVSFSDPVRPPGGGVGRPKHPKIPPPPPKIFFFFCMCFRTPGTFLKKKISREKKLFSVKNSTSPPPPPPTCTPPPSPQNTHPNPRAIINNPNNCSMTYRL